MRAVCLLSLYVVRSTASAAGHGQVILREHNHHTSGDSSPCNARRNTFVIMTYLYQVHSWSYEVHFDTFRQDLDNHNPNPMV